MKYLVPLVVCISSVVVHAETIQETKDTLSANLHIVEKAEAVLDSFRQYQAYKSDPVGAKMQKELLDIARELGDLRAKADDQKYGKLTAKASEVLKMLSTPGPTLESFTTILEAFKSDRLRFKNIKLSGDVQAIVDKADRIVLNPQITEEELNKVAVAKP